MSKLVCNGCGRTSPRVGVPFVLRLYFNECGHILCQGCLSASPRACRLCRAPVDRPVLMKNDDAGKEEDDELASLHTAGGVNGKALAGKYGSVCDGRCRCSITSSSTGFDVVGVRGERFVDLIPNYEVCGHCRRNGTRQPAATAGSTPTSSGGGWTGLIGGVASAAWKAFVGGT